jgi:hypothetical protein
VGRDMLKIKLLADFHPYFIPHDSHGINTARMAEVRDGSNNIDI